MCFNEVIIKGGLGNQLFCLLFAYKILLRNKKVHLNLNNYSFFKRQDREFVLDKLFPEIFDIFGNSNSYLSYVRCLYAKIFERFLKDNKIGGLSIAKAFSINYWPNCFIHTGYFQKISNSDLDIKSLELLMSNLKPYLGGSKSQFLAAHIRRGDYLLEKHSIHGLIDEKYIIRELQFQLSKQSFKGLTIFTDSPELININKYRDLHSNVVLDKGGNSVDVFKRMLNHKGLVASNSSFSLWAGLLGNIKYFSIPFFWMPGVESNTLGLENIRRYNCDF
jgi:hypothetical protein